MALSRSTPWAVNVANSPVSAAADAARARSRGSNPSSRRNDDHSRLAPRMSWAGIPSSLPEQGRLDHCASIALVERHMNALPQRHHAVRVDVGLTWHEQPFWDVG